LTHEFHPGAGNLPGRMAYAIGAERWIPLVTRRVLCSVNTDEKKIALTFVRVSQKRWRTASGPGAEFRPDRSLVTSCIVPESAGVGPLTRSG
jgi:hypothetical protein